MLIQKETFLKPVDKSGALLVKTFHLYKGFNRKHSYVGNFIKISVKSVKPDVNLKKKSKSIAMLVKSKFKSTKLDGSTLFFYENSCILFKRKMNLRSKEINGPGDFKIRRRKLFYKFPGIL